LPLIKSALSAYVTRLDRIKNEEIRKKSKGQRVNLPQTVVEVIRRRRLAWFGNVSRMSGDRLQTRALLLYCTITGKTQQRSSMQEVDQ